MTFQFKIKLKHVTHPEVKRTVLVPSQFSFHRFHEVIQAAFGWMGGHLYQFSIKGWGSPDQIGEIMEEDMESEDLIDSKKIKLKDIFSSEKQKYIYIYDFGDNWEHEITLEKILDIKSIRAQCLSGSGACPPEDCGGAPGYENLKAIMTNPKDPEHKEMKEWLGLGKNEKWDADNFPLLLSNEFVKSI